MGGVMPESQQKKFCTRCKLRLHPSSFRLKLMGQGEETMFEFSDGWYCLECATEKRKGNKK